jgi:hypothetical protein
VEENAPRYEDERHSETTRNRARILHGPMHKALACSPEMSLRRGGFAKQVTALVGTKHMLCYKCAVALVSHTSTPLIAHLLKLREECALEEVTGR